MCHFLQNIFYETIKEIFFYFIMTETKTNEEIIRSIEILIFEARWKNPMLSDLISYILHNVLRLNELFDFVEVEKSINQFIIEYKNIENKCSDCFIPDKQKDLVNLTCNFYINLLNKCKL